MNKPNIILVMTDDQGYGNLGCTGNTVINTPCIDKFHDESVRLTNYHVGPTCAPTRAGLLTGHYANSTGVWHTVGGRSLLREDEWTIATALQENGYNTGIFGKWHLGDSYPYLPEYRGFKEVVIHGGGGISQTPDYWGNDYFDDTYWTNSGYKKYEGYCTDVFFREAKKFIEKNVNENKPFFCYLTPNAPHSPFNVDKKYSERYKGKLKEEARARFYGMIENIDENFGDLRNHIKKLGIENNTILIFTTDNGSTYGVTYDKDGNIIEGYNAGLRGMKNSEYDGGHRVPFFVSYPDMGIDKGVDYNELCANVDFMPTILDFCNIPFDNKKFHGVTIKDTILNGSSKWKDRFIVTDSQRVPDPIKWRKSAVMKGELRLVNGTELYDLSQDREQKYDIAKENPKIVNDFRKAYEEWWEIVSTKFKEPIPLHIHGETHLNSHDWRGDDSVWNQAMIRKGVRNTGYWEVVAEKEGLYDIKMYRWPPETNYSLTKSIEGDDTGFKKEFIGRNDWEYYQDGEAIPISSASIFLDNKCIGEKKVTDKSCSHISIQCYLPKGIHLLEARFTVEDGKDVGCYYVTIIDKE